MTKTLIFISILFICSCSNRTDRIDPPLKVSIQWQYLTFEINDTVIKLYRMSDTLEVASFKKKSQKYQITESQKDSLFACANKLMDYKKQPNRVCTDYIGKLKVRIKYNSQVSKESNFSSICNWRELDENTNRIDQLLKKVMRSQ